MLNKLLDATATRSMRGGACAGPSASAACTAIPHSHAQLSAARRVRLPNGDLMPVRLAFLTQIASQISASDRPPKEAAYPFFPKTFLANAAAAMIPTMTNFFPASSATSIPLKNPAFAASPPATSAAKP